MTKHVTKIGEKTLYNYSGMTLNQWIKQELKNLKKKDVPRISSSIKILVNDKPGKLVVNALGCYTANGNNSHQNMTNVAIFTTMFSSGGLSVIPENFEKVCAAFTARKSIRLNWKNNKDEYMVPNTEISQYRAFVNDSIVYSLFNDSSQQSSLRQIEYKNEYWDIKNEFFWLSNEEMKKLAEFHNFKEMYNDAIQHGGDRYVYKKLQEITISPEAQNVLDLINNHILSPEFMKQRIKTHYEHPEFHLNAWDAGWAQLRRVSKIHFPKINKDIRDAYIDLENKLTPQVYELGFLKK